MQSFLNILRWTVGLLFIFSGLIKANDPLGLSYKMDEFFDVWGVAFLSDYSLALSIIMNTLEIIAGVALLIKYPYKLTLWILFALILFFTFLTGFALFSGKIKTCGCFGDCLPLTPLTSFIKDIILFFAITILIIFQKKIKTKIHTFLGVFILILSTTGLLYGQNYVLHHLPFIDCLPYKAGNDILTEMKTPEGAIPDSISIQMEFSKNGKKYVFDVNAFPDDFDSTYIFESRKEVLVRKGNSLQASIIDFNLTTLSGTDSTKEIFSITTPYVLVFSGIIENSIPWESLLNILHKKYKFVYIVTADKSGAEKVLSNEQILIGDVTMIKTAARVWPTVFIMNGSTIMLKKPYTELLKK